LSARAGTTLGCGWSEGCRADGTGDGVGLRGVGRDAVSERSTRSEFSAGISARRWESAEGVGLRGSLERAEGGWVKVSLLELSLDVLLVRLELRTVCRSPPSFKVVWMGRPPSSVVLGLDGVLRMGLGSTPGERGGRIASDDGRWLARGGGT
jgi:hypothetical protein